MLLHAAMGTARRYYAWVPPLSRHFRVVRMDLRGHGSSQIPGADRELTVEPLVSDVAELMDHLDCTGAHIVGNSAGNLVPDQWVGRAAKNSERCSAYRNMRPSGGHNLAGSPTAAVLRAKLELPQPR